MSNDSTGPVNRVPAGVPTGGQFATSTRNEAGVVLRKAIGEHHPGCTRGAGHNGPCEPNAYTDAAKAEREARLGDLRSRLYGPDANPTDADWGEYRALRAQHEHALFYPPAPLTAHDADVLTEYKGTFADGYDDEKVNRVFMRLESARLFCVWDSHDADGYHGGSEFYGVALEGYEASAGHFTERPTGSYREMHPDVWDYLHDPHSIIDPERIPSLLADEVTQAGDPGRDMADLDGDGFRNVTLRSEWDQEDTEERDDYVSPVDKREDDVAYSGSGWGSHRPTETVTAVAQVRVGDVLADFDDMAQARNLLRVTSVDTERGILHGIFVSPRDTDEKRLSSDSDQAVWDFNLERGAYSFTDIRGPQA